MKKKGGQKNNKTVPASSAQNNGRLHNLNSNQLKRRGNDNDLPNDHKKRLKGERENHTDTRKSPRARKTIHTSTNKSLSEEEPDVNISTRSEARKKYTIENGRERENPSRSLRSQSDSQDTRTTRSNSQKTNEQSSANASDTSESEEEEEDDGDDAENEEELDEDEENDSDVEITLTTSTNDKEKAFPALHQKYGVLQRQLAEAKREIQTIKDSHESRLKEKNETISRLKVDLSWKDEQLEEMNELSIKNMELESKLNQILSDKKAYEEEVERVEEEKNKREKKSSETSEKDKKGKAKAEKQGEKKANGKKGRRRGRREKKGDTSEGEDIDALFVSDDDDVKIVNEEEKSQERETIDITDEDSDTEVPPDSSQPSPHKSSQSASAKAASKTESTQKAAKTSSPQKARSAIEIEPESKEEDLEDSQEDDSKKDKSSRHTIRKVMTGKKLTEETKQAAKTEKERRERARKEHDKHEVVTGVDPKTKLPMCTKLVLAFKEQTEKDKGKPKQPLVEVNPRLIKKLKPHQWEALEFLWGNLIESVDKLKSDDPGQGCILAHCMGLGKTLTMISLIHTLLSNQHTGHFTTCLVVCPLNVIINWQNEWYKWLDKRDRLPVFEMATCKHGQDRAKLLREWHSSGGVMIMGYQLFRLLANYTGKSKKCKAAFEETLLNPGPDLVVCDEGHVLKNDSSAISRAMNRIRTQRRVVLTGTPLQNNLVEYHCMMSFVKPSLLGTSREFRNRFVNPITNGQHSDSTAADVRLMKRRAHILHAMLEGCIQRKDYSVLTKLLPPKHEYVVSVRLSELQIKLYEKYLELHRPTSTPSGEGGGAPNVPGVAPVSGAGLFSDYQNLMRIWTHPYVLRMDEIRQEKKKMMEKLRLAKKANKPALENLNGDKKPRNTRYKGPQGYTITVCDTVAEEPKALEYQDDELDELDEEDTSSPSSEDEQESSSSEVWSSNSEQGSSGEAAESGEFRPSSKKSMSSKQRLKIKARSARKTRSQGAENGVESETANATKSSDASSKRKLNTVKRIASSAEESAASSGNEADEPRKAKVLGGEVIRQWKSSFRHGGNELLSHEDIHRREEMWWSSMVDEEKTKKQLEISGKLVVLFEIIRMSETLGDKVLVFSQSLLTLDLIEDFLRYKDEEAEQQKTKKGQKPNFWKKGEDYLRMDGSTGAQHRTKFTENFNDVKDSRLRLFLISTRAGGLGINLDSANRVVIFDASWNPSHDIQSIFRVYRFGQVKPVYVYRLLAQGTMEEKIYERQVTKETLSQRVIDEQQIDRHFTMSDLAELYNFSPDRLNDPNAPKRPTPAVPKDLVLAELLTSQRDWIVKYHEHDSLLERRPDEDLTEEEREKAWEEYEREKKGLYTKTLPFPNPHLQTGESGVAPVSREQQLYVYNRQTNTYTGNINPVGLQKVPPKAVTNPSNYINNSTLPRVVQEILKYNPNITTVELQKRLQAFLGMQVVQVNQNTIPQTKGPTSILKPMADGRRIMLKVLPKPINAAQPVTSTSAHPSTSAYQSNNSTVPRASSSPTLTSAPTGGGVDVQQLPSRLPLPGHVPALKK